MSPHACFEGGVMPQQLATSSSPMPANGSSNKPTAGATESPTVKSANKSLLEPASSEDDVLDLVCVGFGPANLALAIALHDALASTQPIAGLGGIHQRKPKVLFLERQEHFGWHEGMLLPGTKMQISFIKDLATLRDPRSQFTFLNYLHSKDRLVHFTNLGTFLPARLEYQDYMKWCASWFEDVVNYGRDVDEVSPIQLDSSNGVTDGFSVTARNSSNGQAEVYRAKNVVVAIGGKPNFPAVLPQHNLGIIHSSQYAKRIGKVLPDANKAYNVAVVGAGQSAAEVFNDLHSRYPNAKTTLVFRASALRPSDDSPFVNEIFDPDRVDRFYQNSTDRRAAALAQDKATNYSVVRLELLEHIYGKLYAQSIREPDDSKWQHRILAQTEISSAETGGRGIELQLRPTPEAEINGKQWQGLLDADAVIVATGYQRNAHEAMLAPAARSLMEGGGKWHVQRDYKVELDKAAVSEDAGIWLAGCNETTHGLSDTLLSILATRGGELVRSIFADERYKA